MKKLLATAVVTLGMSISAQAGLINVNVTCTGVLGAGTCIPAAVTAIEDLANADVPDIGADKFAAGFATATAYAGTGLSDYSDNFDLFMVRVNAGVGLSVEEGALDSDADNTSGGFAVIPSLSVGVNFDMLPIDKLGPIELSKLDMVASIMQYDIDQDNDDTNIQGEISSFSLMFRYHWFEDVALVPGKLVHWGGLHLHTGFRRSTFDAAVTSNLGNSTNTQDIGGNSTVFNVTNMIANFDLKNTVNTIPIEVSTYMRLGWAFTFYAGLAADMNMGEGEMTLEANGNLTASTSGGGGGSMTGTINADAIDGKGDAISGMRAFGGFQLNLPYVRLLNLAISKNLGGDNDSYGVRVGLVKVLW